MANNRMWIINDRLGTKALLAKYYPSTGWYPVQTVDHLSAMFDADEQQSQWGAQDYRIVFEMSDEGLQLADLRTVTSAGPTLTPQP